MTRLLPTLALALPLAGGCATFSASSANGLDRVDEFLGRVERVHVECVLSRERMKEALVSLREIVSPDFQGDALASFARFTDSVDRCDEQEAELAQAVGPMERTADEIFARWAENLEAITSESMQRHGRDRMEESKARYVAILDALVPAQAGLAEFNARIRDHALFLATDFSASAVAGIEHDVVDVLALARDLDTQLEAVEAACESYVKRSALRGQDSLSRTQADASGARVGRLVARDAR